MEQILDRIEQNLSFQNKLMSLGLIATCLGVLNWVLFTNCTATSVNDSISEMQFEDNSIAENIHDFLANKNIITTLRNADEKIN